MTVTDRRAHVHKSGVTQYSGSLV